MPGGKLEEFLEDIIAIAGVIALGALLAQILTRVLEVYECPSCKGSVTKGTQTCPNCGAYLDWA